MPINAAVAVPHPPLIIPQVGHRQRKEIQLTVDSYEKAMEFLAEKKPETVVVLSPHTTLYSNYFHISPGHSAKGNFGSFGAPRVRIEAQYDTDLVKAISEEAEKRDIPAGTRGEREAELDHATMIPLWFLDRVFKHYETVRIGLSGLSASTHYAFGRCIAAASQDKNVVVIASGDLSHRLTGDGPYGFRPEGPELDSQITAALGTADFASLLSIDEELAEKGSECGLRAFWIMAGMLDGRSVDAKLVSYEGTLGVGYAVATFQPGAPDDNRRFDERNPS